MSDPRVQTDNPAEPLFTDGAFHIELIDDAWGVYDAYDNRVHLYFATDTEAIDACIALSASADPDALDVEYARQLVLARASMEVAA